MPPPRPTWATVLTTYSTARSKAHKRNTAAALEKKSFPFPHRAHEGKSEWYGSTCSPTKSVAGGHHRHQRQEDQQDKGEVGGHQPPQNGLPDTPPSVM